MAKISETELQRRLRALETKGPPGGTIYFGTTDPVGTDYVDGDTWYDSVLNNLWIFSDGVWVLTSKQLHIRYATEVTDIGVDGKVELQNQVTGFSITPFDSNGVQKAWRGLWWGSTPVASTDPTDYEWTLTSGADGYSPELGVDYDNGVDGIDSYLHIKYSDDGGSTFTSNDGEDIGNWIGTYTDSTEADSTNVNFYTWVKFVPEKGVEYDDGVNAYFHVKYSDDGTTFSGNSGEDIGNWIGTYTDANAADSTTFGDYTWVKFIPEKGTEYDDGDAGTSAYIHIKYSDDGTTFTANGGEDVGYYMGTLIDETETDSTTFGDYTWVKFVPEKGVDYDDGESAYMHIKYSNDGTTFTGNNGEDVGSWIGTYSDNTEADSTTFSDYTWKKIEGNSPVYVRYYSNYPGLYSEMGDPDNPGSGVTWTLFTGAAPSTAYWVAEKFTVGSTTSAWMIFPVQAKDGGIPFVTYTITGSNMPTLGDSTWIDHAVEAVEVFTGRDYSNQKEFGYGTTVVITYDDGKLYGRYTRDSSGADTWVSPASFIDGNLIVDGSVAAEQIDANAINSTHLTVSGVHAIDASTVGALPTSLYTSGTTTIDGGHITTGTVTASSIKVVGTGAVTASTISADAAGTGAAITDNIYTSGTTTINGGMITTGSVAAEHLSSNSIDTEHLASGSVTSDTITLDGYLEFTENSSGIHFGKGSLFDGSAGAFFGRSLAADGTTEIVGLSISSSTSQMTMASNGDLNISGAKIFSGAPGTPTEITSSGTFNLPVGTSEIDVVITGGGGGGPTNAASDRPTDTQVSGSDGVDTVVKFYSGSNGTGTLLNTYTAAGGDGGVYSVISNYIDRVGTPGQSSGAPGSTGGSAGNIPSGASGKSTGIGDGTRGGGGGSGGANGDNGSQDAASNNGGSAGQTLSFAYDASGASSYVVTIGAGGAGGVPAQLGTYIATGGDGGSGYVGITNSIAGGDLIDFDDFFILPSNSDMEALSYISSSSHNSYHTAPQGAGWYWVSGGIGYGSSYWSHIGLVPWGVDITDNGSGLELIHYSNSSAKLYYKKLF
jgi:hypothetical protein